MKERNYNYDIMRIIACIMIICMHAPLPADESKSLILNMLGYFTAPGLCMFFVLSGALLLPVKMDTFLFLKKRLGKVIMPTVCFSLLYLILNALLGNEIDWVSSLCSIPFSAQGHGILWFMYTLIGLYLISPILSKWLQSTTKRELELYLCLWCLTLCYPILKLFLQLNDSNTGILYYFTGYAGYFLLGYYLKTYPEALSLKRLVIPVAIAIVTPVLCKLIHIQVDFYSLFWYLSIFVAILTVTMYQIINITRIEGRKLSNIIVLGSNLSFGIYLVHIAVMRFWLWKQDWIINISNYYLQFAVVVVLTFAISFIITYLIGWLPFGDHIIGFKFKNSK